MSSKRLLLSMVAFLLFLVACSSNQATENEQAANSVEPEQLAQVETATSVPPTSTPEPTATVMRAAANGLRASSQSVVVRQLANDDAKDGDIVEIASDQPIRITVASANLRSGPGLAYETIGVVLFDDAFRALAQDELGLWYKVQLADGTQGWVAASVTEEISEEALAEVSDTANPDSAEAVNPSGDEPVEEIVISTEADDEAAEAASGDDEPTNVLETIIQDAETAEAAATVPDPPLAIQITSRRTGIYSEPTTSSPALTFVVRDEVYLVNDMSDDGRWVLVTIEEGLSGWVRMTRAGALDEAGLTALVGANYDENQVGPLARSGNGTPGQTTNSNPVISSSASASVSTAAVSGSFGTSRIRPGSPLYYDADGTGYGIREAIAPSGPSGIITSENIPTKSQTAGEWEEGDRYSQQLPRIMLLGDQFTAGTTPIANGYRRYLYNLLTARDFAFDFVGTMNTYTSPEDFDSDHEGHVYYRADQILAGAWGWTSYDPPDYVLMLVGMNDVLQGQSAESTGEDIQLILNTLRYLNPNVKIVLSHLPYTADPVINQEIDLVNLQINRLSYVNNTGNSPIYVISQWDIDPSMDTYDGIHLNATGAQKMAQHFYYGLDHFWLVQSKVNGE